MRLEALRSLVGRAAEVMSRLGESEVDGKDNHFVALTRARMS
jgi:hypothetical protein